MMNLIETAATIYIAKTLFSYVSPPVDATFLQVILDRMKENPIFAFMFSWIKRYWVMRIWIHEGSHLLALRWMGYDGVIKATNLDAVYPLTKGGELLRVSELTLNQRRFFYGAGSLGQIIYATYNILFTDESEEEIMVDLMIIIHGIIYGYFEGFLPRVWWTTGGTIGFLAGWIFLSMCLIKRSRDLSQS